MRQHVAEEEEKEKKQRREGTYHCFKTNPQPIRVSCRHWNPPFLVFSLFVSKSDKRKNKLHCGDTGRGILCNEKETTKSAND